VTLLETTFAGRRVLVTGHTGFKGAWLTWWLHRLGADVTGFALAAQSPSMYESLNLDSACDSIIGDVRDGNAFAAAVEKARPDFVFHLAAQSLVLASYDDPLGTISTNVMGTAHLLDVLRLTPRPVVAIVVTSDKCYENDGTVHSFRESDPMGGGDVYSMSKGAAELVVSSYRRSFFAQESGVRVASARAGNVIGGGDWAANRLVPDCIRALSHGQSIGVRNPRSVRPWQHVLEPLSGYLLLAARTASEGDSYCEAWNFGPAEDDACSVEELVEGLIAAWGSGNWVVQDGGGRHEAAVLRLCTDKASQRLGWSPRWALRTAIEKTVEWYKEERSSPGVARLRALTTEQIAAYAKEAHDGSRR